MTGWVLGGRGSRPALPPVAALRPWFPDAAWLWDPIPTNPVEDDNTAAWTTRLAASAPGAMNLYEYAVPIYQIPAGATGVPTYTIDPTESWGGQTLTGVPIPTDAAPAPGSDAAMVVIDHRTGHHYEFYGLQWTGSTWTCLSMERYTFRTGQGIGEGLNGTGVIGAGFSRLAGVVTRTELERAVATDGDFGHAMVFSCVFAQGPSGSTNYRHPAKKTDGNNLSGGAVTVPEGARFQINPAFNAATISHPVKRAQCRTLQKYGAYNIDNGGATSGPGGLAFIFQGNDPTLATPRTNPGDPTAVGGWARALGIEWDYYAADEIPYNQGRWLANWNGS